MVEIPEYKRDESKDLKFILESLNEIPFPVGKKLLIDFLKGNSENNSIVKNKLNDFEKFGVLNYLPEGRIIELIENLIYKNFIKSLPSVFNRDSKGLKISGEGKNELIAPAESKKNFEDIKISNEEIKFFDELGGFLKNFNEEQKKVIISQNEKILCIAGAGSGKTTILTKRIEFLAKYKRIHSEKILAMTFTRKAKEEMEKRLRDSGVRAVVETFNSFCEKILIKNERKIYKRKMKVANFQDKMVAVLRALDDMGLTIHEAVKEYFNEGEKISRNFYELQNLFVSDCFEVFDSFKVSKLSINEFKEKYFKEGGIISKIMLNMIIFLERYFTSFGLRTYTDQIGDILSFFRMNPKFVPEFEDILVDEFQDVNHEQIELLEVLNPKNLFCVGDPRQSIFGWRGSKISYILDFKEKYPDSKILYLKKNYRSPEEIVKFMNISIKDMKLPDLEANYNGKGKIRIDKFKNEKEEFEFVKEKILESGAPRKEIFVLARTNRQIQDLSVFLKKHRINHILKNETAREAYAKEGEVTLSTIHSAKGLESEIVFIIGCTNSNFPSRYSEHPIIEKIKIYNYNKTEEERRLFYVAISRAKKEIYITYSGKKHTHFIDEEMKRLAEE